MSIADYPTQPDYLTPVPASSASRPTAPRRMHRIREVREQQGMSIRSVARHLGMEMRTARAQEAETTDLKLSELYQWQEVLDVPVADLLVDEESPVSRPVLERARLVKIMKTAAAILERADSPATRRLATMLVDQLVELMPELKDVTPWHAVGHRRSLDEYGRVVERLYSSDPHGDDE